MDSTENLAVGMEVTGTGIAANSTVSSITNATTFELNQAATATNSNTTLTFKVTSKFEQKLAKINLRHLVASSGNLDDTIIGVTGDAERTALPKDYLKFARSIQFRIKGTAATTFEINDISLVYKDKRIK